MKTFYKVLVLSCCLAPGVAFSQIATEEVQVREGLGGKVVIGSNPDSIALEINGHTVVNGTMGETGSWTPLVKAGSAAGYGTGTFIKISRLVHCQFALHISSAGSVLEIGGLPYKLGSFSGSVAEVALVFIARNKATGAFQPYYGYLVNWSTRNFISGANPGPVLGTDIVISGQFTYFTND